MAGPDDDSAKRNTTSAAADTTTIYQRIVDAAAKSLQSPQAMPSVADMAALAGVDPAIASEMFADDDALGAAVAEDAIVRVGDYVGHSVALVPVDDPGLQMRAIMLSHLEWGMQHPVTARMVLDPNVPVACRAVYQRYVTSMQDLWRTILARCEERGKLNRNYSVDVAEMLGRSLVLGMGRILTGDDNDFLRDRDTPALYAMMVESVNAYCDQLYL